MSCCNQITDLSQAIWLDLGQPSGQGVPYIQTKLVSQPFVGQLNNLLGTYYTSVSGCISPELGPDEQAIASLYYQTSYYTTILTQTLAGIIPGTVGALQSTSEGDSKISFSNPIDRVRIYRDMQRQLNTELIWASSAYRQAGSLPRSVDYPTIVNVLAGYGAYGAGYAASAAGYPRGYYRS